MNGENRRNLRKERELKISVNVQGIRRETVNG
jgi:hypothetical protein